jgi:hypothetical protein
VAAVVVTLAVATVVASTGTTGTRRPPSTATAERHAAAHPAIAGTPAPVVTAAVAGASDPGALYVLYAASARGAGPARVERVSRLLPERLTGAALPAGADLVRAGDSLWVAGGALPALYRVDPRTLELRQRIALPAPALAITATPAALWMGGPGRLSRVDLGSGAVTAGLPVDGEVTSLSADPAGRRLYAAVTAAQGTTVTERDARTGAVTAARRLAPGGGHLAAAASGVWVWQEHATPPGRPPRPSAWSPPSPPGSRWSPAADW